MVGTAAEPRDRTGAGHPMNIIMVIAVYAVICRELGIPLWFPGSHAGLSILLEATDVAHLANAAIWTATSRSAATRSSISPTATTSDGNTSGLASPSTSV